MSNMLCSQDTSVKGRQAIGVFLCTISLDTGQEILLEMWDLDRTQVSQIYYQKSMDLPLYMPGMPGMM